MTRNGARSLKAGLLLTVMLSSPLFGCAGGARKLGERGGLISVTLPMASYAKMRPEGTNNKELLLFFPQLRIYDGSGNLVYSSHESLDNARVLMSLPDGITTPNHCSIAPLTGLRGLHGTGKYAGDGPRSTPK